MPVLAGEVLLGGTRHLAVRPRGDVGGSAVVHGLTDDLLTDARYRWQGYHSVVGLDPGTLPVHVFAVRRWNRSEADFEYFL